MTPRPILALTFAAFVAAACDSTPRPSADAATPVASTAFTAAERALFAPLPLRMDVAGQPGADAMITLGRALYYERTLSVGHVVSCNGCHPLNAWGADGRKLSLGHDGRPGSRNAPTVYNAAGHIAQFWDGRAKDVEAQAIGPILNPVEMGMPDSAAVLAHLHTLPAFVTSFRAAFPGETQPVTWINVGRAIGAFERGLVTSSRWDRFLLGDSASLTVAERRGLRTFLATGCQTCHAGVYMGGDRFMKAGLVNPWFSQADSGRFNVTHDPKDLFVFKVPSLRNVERTGPYFNDGSVADLGEAVRRMAHHQLGKELAPADVQSIVTFLTSLTGDLPAAYIAFPQKAP